MITPKDYIDDDLKEEIHIRDSGICQICGKQGKWRYFGAGRVFACEYKDIGTYDYKWRWLRFHLDHIMPEGIGGKTNPNNLRLLCRKCNLSRSKYALV